MCHHISKAVYQWGRSHMSRSLLFLWKLLNIMDCGSEEEHKFWIRSPQSKMIRFIMVSIIDLPRDRLLTANLRFSLYTSDKWRKCSFLRDKSERIDLECTLAKTILISDVNVHVWPISPERIYLEGSLAKTSLLSDVNVNFWEISLERIYLEGAFAKICLISDVYVHFW